MHLVGVPHSQHEETSRNSHEGMLNDIYLVSINYGVCNLSFNLNYGLYIYIHVHIHTHTYIYIYIYIYIPRSFSVAGSALSSAGVVLAGHSMGGAVMWQYLELFGQDQGWHRVTQWVDSREHLQETIDFLMK